MSQSMSVHILFDFDSDDNRTLALGNDAIDLTTPPLSAFLSKKKQRTKNLANSSVFIIDDDPTPCKPPQPCSTAPVFSFTPSDAPETLFSDVSIVKCSNGKSSSSGQQIVLETPISELLKIQVPNGNCSRRFDGSKVGCSLVSNSKNSGIHGLISVESDDESENVGGFEAGKNDESDFAAELANESEFESRLVESSFPLGSSIELHKKFAMGNVHMVQIPESNLHPITLEDATSMVSCPRCMRIITS